MIEQGPAGFQIAGKPVERGRPAFIVGEVAQAHDGSLGLAHAFIDAIARTGADAVKFQTHIAAAESTPHEMWRVKFSRQDATRYEYWQRMEFTAEQWAGLKEHAEAKGLIFLSSPFSEEAVELLKRIGMPAWKVASGELDNPLLLQCIANTGKPTLLSTGMSPLSEIDKAVTLLRRKQVPLAVLQCSSAYPCPPTHVGLNVLEELRQRYCVPVGLSDHSGTIYASIAAAALGVELIEVHVTLSREMFGPDVPASLTTEDLGKLVEGVRFVEQAMSQPVDKSDYARELDNMRRTFGKSVVLRCDLPAGTVLERSHLAVKKPGTGIPAREMNRVIGRVLSRDGRADEPMADAWLAAEASLAQ